LDRNESQKIHTRNFFFFFFFFFWLCHFLNFMFALSRRALAPGAGAFAAHRWNLVAQSAAEGGRPVGEAVLAAMVDAMRAGRPPRLVDATRAVAGVDSEAAVPLGVKVVRGFQSVGAHWERESGGGVIVLIHDLFLDSVRGGESGLFRAFFFFCWLVFCFFDIASHFFFFWLGCIFSCISTCSSSL
jgi:hypothetical protein